MPMIRPRWSRVGLWFALLVTASAALVRGADAVNDKKGGRGGGGGRGKMPAGALWWREIDTGPFISDTIRTSRDLGRPAKRAV